jgi:hypothetical protein
LGQSSQSGSVLKLCSPRTTCEICGSCFITFYSLLTVQMSKYNWSKCPKTFLYIMGRSEYRGVDGLTISKPIDPF